MGRKKPAARDEENAPAVEEEGVLIDDDEYSVGIELAEETQVQEEKVVITGKKKGKKGNQKGFKEEEGVGEEEEAPDVVFAGKKKSKGKKSGAGGNTGFSSSNFALLGGDEDDDGNGDEDEGSDLTGEKDSDEQDESVASFKGKTKGKGNKESGGGSLFSASAFDAIDDGENDGEVEDKEEDDDDMPVIEFTGKKKKSAKGGKKGSGSVFLAASLDGLDENEDGEKKDEDEDVGAITFSGKKKSSKSSKKSGINKFSATLLDEENDEDASVSESVKTSDDVIGVEDEDESVVAFTARTSCSARCLVEKEGEEDKEESAAAKKKKKKKEKEKEKKVAAAAAAVAKEEAKAETSEPKKTDAKAKRNGGEKSKGGRGEEEEGRRGKTKARRLERQAEEARRRKKEREKEKLLKKKQEGKLLTGKQKEEQRRLEAMRNQILANAGVTVPTADRDNGPTKRPRYQTKKSKPAHHQANGIKIEEHVDAKGKEQEEQDEVHEVETVELEKAEPAEEEKTEVANVPEENGMEEDDDDEEWDAKSWDDVNLNVKGAFDDEEDSEPEHVVKKKQRVLFQLLALQFLAKMKKDAAVKNKAVVSDSIPKQAEENLRSPICCIMGHVDTGKTKLLDCIRGTNVQEGEAGGITQQIGATYFPAENIRERTKELKADAKLNVPGLLVIDTPGHESFTNLRSRGSGLSTTIESLNLLRMRNTEFIVALNKVDRLYAWKAQRNAPIRKTLKQQSKDVQNEFDRRLIEVITQFKEQGLNTELYYKNKDMGETFNIVPTSAISGEGIPDLLLLLIQWSQKTMIEKLTFRNEVQCTVLEVKVIEGHGTTIDVVLVNGVLHEGDQIVVCGLQGPIVTTIRALLTPHPMKELRVKGTYLHHKEIKAAQGIKITGQGLEHAIAGTGLYVVGRDDDVEDVKESAMEDMKSVMSRIDKSGEGVYVQASTLGSLEALLEFLKSPAVSIPVSGIGIGPVHKKDVMKASVMLEKKKEYATILAFDVKVTPEARELSEELGVKIFIADIIYHLFDQFKAYIQNLKEEKKKEAADEAVFPCVLEIIPECIFNKKDPIIMGVDVLEGILKVGTPLCVPQKDYIDLGRIASIEFNKKAVDLQRKARRWPLREKAKEYKQNEYAKVIVGTNAEEQQKMHGRHFDNDDQLVSHITRRSIDILKVNYRDDLSIEDWRLVVKLKTLFKIQ
ncbi:eukaryotic translation initiation factor [Salix suchowensis]|nr:eukaryotic translation initiation factor [Salix suchowensis]